MQLALEWHTFENFDAQAALLSRAVAQALENALSHVPRTLLAVSGGQTPRQFLRQLGQMELPWKSVDITLADDRWVPLTHDDSNARLVRDTLRAGRAAAAQWLPLVNETEEPVHHVGTLNQGFPYAAPDVCVLGMGDDGHIASLFADAPQWPAARQTQERFVLIQPTRAPHVRVSWSLAALRRCPRLFLLIQGEPKRDVLLQAAETRQDTAISLLVHTPGVTLDVYWCAG